MTHQDMPHKDDSTAEDAEIREELDELIRWAWQPALRMALDSHGAPARCKRRACRMAGECRMTVREGEPLDCGGLTGEAVRTAAFAVLFGGLMTRRFVDDVLLRGR